MRRSDVAVSEILVSDHLSVMFHILDHVRTKQISEPREKIYKLGAVSKPSLKSNITQSQN
jgi:hypothetical protein